MFNAQRMNMAISRACVVMVIKMDGARCLDYIMVECLLCSGELMNENVYSFGGGLWYRDNQSDVDVA